MTDSVDTVSATAEATASPDPSAPQSPVEAEHRPDHATPDAADTGDAMPAASAAPAAAPQSAAPQSNPAPASERSTSALPMVLGGIVAAVIGFGLAQVVPQGWPLAPVSGVTAEIAAQKTALAALQTKLDDLSNVPAAKPDPALADRLTAIEAALSALPPAVDLTPLQQRLDAVEGQLTGLSTAPGGTTSTVDPAALTQLRAEIDALKSGGTALDAKVADAEARLASIKTEAEALATTTAARAALGQMQAALDSGAPYAAALANLPADLPELLKSHATSGLPSLQSLQSSFPAAARAALDAALRASTSDSWTDRLSTFLRGQTGARSTAPREGTDPDAVLSRAEAALGTGDLDTALTELGALPQAGKDAMADWMASATLRQDAVAAVQALSAAVGQ